MTLPPIIRLLRPQEWIKNLFVLAPLFFTPYAATWHALWRIAVGFAAFSAAASAVYIVNDWQDRAADRLHPKKRLRPLAAGTVSVPLALTLAVVLVLAAMVDGYRMDPTFDAILGVYLLVNAAYSAGLKHIAILDVMIIAFGFVLRVLGGAALADVRVSAWIVIATGLLALFLGLAKRRDDLVRKMDAAHRASLDGYSKQFLDIAVAMVLGALLVAYLIYTTDGAVMARLGTEKIYYTSPFVVAGILRYLQIAMVEESSGSPTRVLLTDRFIIVTVLGWAATFAVLLYL